ncbi:sulfatase [Halosimplex pelagicum]|uniref:Sulfatase n=1 Tax=Halosimplex pelagicum TaxID=869886 RepID=A0A7D5TEY4_9EURY|nr:sulfatase [Halosimplex pelagicum]QLH84075.1 sulfatase [Halosimplex pelagicum]
MATDRSEPANVLLVVLDSVRARNCSVLGARKPTTPNLELLARESTLYTQARAPSNWSLPSHVSLFTGLETHEHRVTVDRRLAPGNTAFEKLGERGHDTGLFTENGFVASHGVGLKDAFETVETVPESVPDGYDTAELNPGPDGYYYADRFLSWSDDRDGPWAACLNLMDAHRPFEPRASHDEWGDDAARELQAELPNRWEWTFQAGERPLWQLKALEALYDGGIRQADAILGHVVSTLRERGVLDDTLLVVCGDHGDGFGERSVLDGEPPAVSHIVPMHESLLHVPLLVRRPGGHEARTVRDPAALTPFHDVALAAGAGEPVSAGAFARERVVSTKQPVTGDLRERYERNCESVDPFVAPSRAVYRADPSVDRAVRKTYYWGDAAAELAVHDPGHVHRVGAATSESVDDAVLTRDVSVDLPREATDGGLDPDKKAQLAALGYY